MKIEHIGYQVHDPAAVAEWYVLHLGFSIRRAADHPVPVRFMADCEGQVMLEIYHNPAVTVPEYAAMDPLLFHIAFACEDLPGTITRLTQAGATIHSGPETTPHRDQIAILRDPWGLAIQLANRATPMLEC